MVGSSSASILKKKIKRATDRLFAKLLRSKDRSKLFLVKKIGKKNWNRKECGGEVKRKKRKAARVVGCPIASKKKYTTARPPGIKMRMEDSSSRHHTYKLGYNYKQEHSVSLKKKQSCGRSES